MDTLAKMNEAMDYIEEHLESDIDYEELAKIVCCSYFHFTRMFSFIAGITLSEYIRRRKLSKAALELQNVPTSVLDVALKYGYMSPTSFNRAFQNQHGIPPKAAKEKGVNIKSYPKISFQVTIKGDIEMKVRLEERKAFIVAGIKKRLPTVDGDENFEDITQMWANLSEEQNEGLTALSNGFLKGLIGVSGNNDGKHFDYYIGVTASASSKNGWNYLEIPLSTWAVFEAKGTLPAAIIATWKRIFTEWFPSSGYESVNSPNIEVYSDGDPNAEDYLCEIWVPVRRIAK